ncbi:M56 family metallopeptidase [Croceibacter atlanticus]|uniref:M56 family metallopeptidase n=1 Tax=Croceibacter atlanticus TaxID=313588 RepID=UPI0032B2A89F
MDTLVFFLLKSATIIGLFVLVYGICLQKETLFKANRYFLIGGLISAICIPLVTITKIVYVAPVTLEGTILNNITPIAEQGFQPNWWLVALTIYSIGVAIVGGRFVLQLLSLKRFILKKNSLNKDGINYIKVKDNIAPFSFLNYIIYNPSLHSTNELALILKHEEIHVKQYHTLDVILANLLITLQWFNPLAWVYKNNIEQNLEFLADCSTVDTSICKRDYQLAMVRTSARNSYPEITTNFYQSFIKKRIIMLNKSASNRKSLWKMSLIAPLLLGFIFTFNVKTIAQEHSAVSETQSIASTSSNIVSYESESPKTELITITQRSKATSSRELVEFVVMNVSTKEDLKTIEDKFLTYDAKVNFKNIKRDGNRITALKLVINYKEDSQNYAFKNTKGIQAFSIQLDTKEQKVTIKQHSEPALNVDSTISHSTHIKDNSKEVIVISDNANHVGNNHNVIEIKTDQDDQDIVYYINEKVVTKANVDALQPDHIASVNVVKNDGTGEVRIILKDGNAKPNVVSKDITYFIDGKISSKEKVDALDKDSIERVDVTKNNNTGEVRVTLKKG